MLKICARLYVSSFFLRKINHLNAASNVQILIITNINGFIVETKISKPNLDQLPMHKLISLNLFLRHTLHSGIRRQTTV